MKVKILKSNIDTWYQVGDIVEVLPTAEKYPQEKYFLGYPLAEDRNACVDVDDCEIIEP